MKNFLNFVFLLIVIVGLCVLMNGCICTSTPPAEQSWWEYNKHWGADGHGNWPWYVLIMYYPLVFIAYIF